MTGCSSVRQVGWQHTAHPPVYLHLDQMNLGLSPDDKSLDTSPFSDILASILHWTAAGQLLEHVQDLPCAVAHIQRAVPSMVGFS